MQLQGVTKQYGSLVANDDVSLSVGRGEVVGLLGENGAGKSTLMKVAYGLVRPDTGTLSLDGRPRTLGSPREARAAGIGIVTQEFSLVETMTVTENVALATMPLGRVDLAAARARVLSTLDETGVDLDPDAPVEALSIGERQRVEIVKALVHECRILILDEPTAVLVPQDVEALFSTVTRLRSAGLGVLFVSHKLREVERICDRVVVLRRGRVVAERPIGDVDARTLAALMMGDAEPPSTAAAGALGATDEPAPEEQPHAARQDGPARPRLAVADLTLVRSGRRVLDDVALEVGPGEILGVAGVSGNGQTELLEALAGTATPSGGRIELDGHDITGADVPARLERGLGRLTEDRRASVVGTMTVEDNLVLEDLARFTRRAGLLDRGAVRAHAEELIARYAIRARPTDRVATLSGGNMQKVLLARALARRPRVLLAAQPTRGLDVGAYAYVHEQLLALRNEGTGVLLISEDLDELLALADRLVVLLRGRVVGALDRADATPQRLGLLMTGGEAA
ncbi:UNVERIFIED_CONTAM: ABC transporter [Mumia flava]